MNDTRAIVTMGMRLCIISSLWTLTGCHPRPVDQGHADLQSMGVGVARALSPFLKQGDLVVVFTTPGALGAGAEAEQATVMGLADALESQGVSVSPVEYSPEETQVYLQSFATDLRESFAAKASDRVGGNQAQAFVSLAGWPHSPWLPADTVLVAVDWNPSASMPSWKEYRALIQVVARDGSTRLPPNASRHPKPGEALAWFDQRFAVEVRTR